MDHLDTLLNQMEIINAAGKPVAKPKAGELHKLRMKPGRVFVGTHKAVIELLQAKYEGATFEWE